MVNIMSDFCHHLSTGAWLISDTELPSECLDIYDLSRYLDTISIISVEV